MPWIAFVLGLAPDPCRFWRKVLERFSFLLAICRMCGMPEQALTHETTEIRQSVGYFGGIVVKADGFVLAPHEPPIAFHYK
jgi:hypothetical protein